MQKKTSAKAKDARRGARNDNHDFIVLRRQNDEKYRVSQKVHGWTEDHCPCLDHLTSIDISHTAPWHQTEASVRKTPSRWYAMMMIAKLNCEREKIKSTTHNLTVLQREQGRQNACIPKNERTRQRPFNEALRADLEWHSPNGRSHLSQTFSSSSSQQWVQHEHQDARWEDQQWWKE